MRLYTLIWLYSIYDTVAWAFSSCRLIFLVCATATSFSSQHSSIHFSAHYPLKIYTFSGHLLSIILLFSHITDLCWCFFFSDSYFLILVLFTFAVTSLSFPCILCTLETAIFFSEYMAFSSIFKSVTLILICFSSSVRRAISCFLYVFVYLGLSALTWLILCYSKENSMDDTSLSLSYTTYSSSPYITKFASFDSHRLISGFF